MTFVRFFLYYNRVPIFTSLSTYLSTRLPDQKLNPGLLLFICSISSFTSCAKSAIASSLLLSFLFISQCTLCPVLNCSLSLTIWSLLFERGSIVSCLSLSILHSRFVLFWCWQWNIKLVKKKIYGSKKNFLSPSEFLPWNIFKSIWKLPTVWPDWAFFEIFWIILLLSGQFTKCLF